MAALETAMEWLRPLANTKPWDYIVIWKLGDDPSSAANTFESIKDENGVQKRLIDECRDQFLKHSIRTRACKKLARLPSVIPLYSGIHGDVVTSKQPVWTTSASDNEPICTQVLVPVPSGLIEISASKHVPRDQKMIDYVLARFRQETMANLNIQEHPVNLDLKEHLCQPHSYNYPENWKIHYINSVNQPNCSSFEGSSTCSSLSNEGKPGSDHAPTCLSRGREQLDLRRNNLKTKRKRCEDPALARGNDKVCAKNLQKGPYKSKNLVTERNRRKRIKAGMFALRALVPNITKMDRAATLGDAADYIEELLETIEEYNEQLRAMEDNECSKINTKADLRKPITHRVEGKPVEAKVEVNQLGTKGFLVKLVCGQKRGGFSRMMEAMEAIGLQVVDANVSTLNGSVSNVLRVEANKEEVDPKTLECLLIRLAN